MSLYHASQISGARDYLIVIVNPSSPAKVYVPDWHAEEAIHRPRMVFVLTRTCLTVSRISYPRGTSPGMRAYTQRPCWCR